MYPPKTAVGTGCHTWLPIRIPFKNDCCLCSPPRDSGNWYGAYNLGIRIFWNSGIISMYSLGLILIIFTAKLAKVSVRCHDVLTLVMSTLPWAVRGSKCSSSNSFYLPGGSISSKTNTDSNCYHFFGIYYVPGGSHASHLIIPTTLKFRGLLSPLHRWEN